MKKVYRIKELDCANCAAKMERAIRKIDGVLEVEINFMSQRMVLEYDESRVNEIHGQVKQCVAKVDPRTIILDM